MAAGSLVGVSESCRTSPRPCWPPSSCWSPPGRWRRTTPPPPGNPERGAELAPLCTSCHGREGRSNISRYPSIAGMAPALFRERMEALQAGDGGHLLKRMTQDLSDQNIADLAAHFAILGE